MNIMFNTSTSCAVRPAKLKTWRSALLTLFITLMICSASTVSAQQTYKLGSGQTTTSDYPVPYANQSKGAHHQIMIRASELTTLGATSGYLTSLKLSVSTHNSISVLSDFTIKVKAVSENEVINVFDADDWTTVYSASSYTVANGWNNHTFSNSFFWDGTSNLLVDICFRNENTSSNAVMLRSTTPFNSVVYYRGDEASLCTTTEVTDVSNSRPDMELTIEPPMVFSYSDVRHVTNATVLPGDKAARMLRVEIFANGLHKPLVLSNLLFSAQGTSDQADIRNARVYYTGKDENFSTDNQFGKTVTNPAGLFAVSGDQKLSSGSNFFWLVYEIGEGAGLANTLDVALQSHTIDGSTKAPTNSALAGTRTIWPYCASGATSATNSYIGEVVFGDMRNTSPDSEAKTGAAYTNYTGIKPEFFLLDHTYEISVVKKSLDQNNKGWVNVFIDWNRNGVFESDERVFNAEARGGASSDLPTTYSGKVTVPYTAALGKTGMRVVLQDEGTGKSDPCGAYAVGETEDYVIVVEQPAELKVVGKTDFGSVGSERRMSLVLNNISPIESLSLSKWALQGKDASNFRIYTQGTEEEFPQEYVIEPNSSVTIDIAFGGSYTTEGWHGANFTVESDGIGNATNLMLTGYYASLRAFDESTDLLNPAAKFDVGIAESSDEFGATVSSRWFSLSSNSTPLQTPILIKSYTITGPDAELFHISSLPFGVGSYTTLISVSVNGFNTAPGVKHATLTIEHSAANGSPITVHLTGRVGRSLLQAPSYVNLQPVALSTSYATQYQNATLIPLTQKGSAPVEITGTPVLTGSGAAKMELLSNAGLYFIRAKYDDNGILVPAYDLALENTWRGPVAGKPIVVSEAQPWLIAVRMKSPLLTDITGSYNADIVFSDGMGNGISNALNEVAIQVTGEIVKDVNLLAFSPVQLAFGTVPVGSSVSKTLTLRNQSGVEGRASLSITGTEFSFADGSSFASVELPADNSPVTLEVRFAPSNTGSINGTLVISGVIAGSLPMNGLGQTASPDNLQILVNGQPLSGALNFGNVAVGQVMTHTVTIVNNNPGPVTISSVGRSGANATQFAIGDISTMTIAGNGGTASFPVKFVPTSVSSPEKHATITVFNNSGGSRTINVRGTAVAEGGVTVSVQVAPSSYNFGNQTGSYEFTVINNGSQAIEISGAMIIGAPNFTVVDAASSFPRTVSAGGTTTITVHFNSTLGANGLRSGSLLLITPAVTPYPTVSLLGRVGTAIAGSSGNVQSSGDVVTGALVNIDGNFPNPFSSETTVRFTLAEEAPVTLHLYNNAGIEVRTLQLGVLAAGERSVALSAQALPSGTYRYTVEAGNSRAHGVMVIVR